MFGMGLKKSTAEAISRGVRASLTGAYFHPQDIRKFGLNDEASAVLLTEVYAHHLFALWLIYKTFCKNDKWADGSFFLEAAFRGMLESEKQYGTVSATTLSSILFRRLKDFTAYGFPSNEMERGLPLITSINLIVQNDSSANEDIIFEAIAHSTHRYSRDVTKMF